MCLVELCSFGFGAGQLTWFESLPAPAVSMPHESASKATIAEEEETGIRFSVLPSPLQFTN